METRTPVNGFIKHLTDSLTELNRLQLSHPPMSWHWDSKCPSGLGAARWHIWSYTVLCKYSLDFSLAPIITLPSEATWTQRCEPIYQAFPKFKTQKVQVAFLTMEPWRIHKAQPQAAWLQPYISVYCWANNFTFLICYVLIFNGVLVKPSTSELVWNWVFLCIDIFKGPCKGWNTMKRYTVCVTNNKNNLKLSMVVHTVSPATQRQREEHFLSPVSK